MSLHTYEIFRSSYLVVKLNYQAIVRHTVYTRVFFFFDDDDSSFETREVFLQLEMKGREEEQYCSKEKANSHGFSFFRFNNALT